MIAREHTRATPVNALWDSQRVARTGLVIAVVAASVWTLWNFLPALVWAAVLAIATWPLRTALVRRGVGRTSVATLLTLVLAFAVVVPLITIGIEAAKDSGALMDWVREVHRNGLATPGWLSGIPYVGSTAAAWWEANLAGPGAISALIGHAEASGILSFSRALGVEVASRLTILIFTLVTLFFLYRDGDTLAKESQIIGERLFGPPGGRLGRNAIVAVRGSVNGLVLVGLAEGVLLGIAYALAGLSHATSLGLATGVLATIPFGAPVIFIICAAVLLAQSKTVFGTVVATGADHFARPALIGNSTRLPFLLVLLGILGGLETFGLIGLFIGPAIMSVLVAIWREAAEPESKSAEAKT
jgi:predicted PurR-regulated permease PerM